MNARSIAAVAVPALVAGALLGYFIRPSDSAAPAEKPQPTHENQSAKKELYVYGRMSTLTKPARVPILKD